MNTPKLATSVLLLFLAFTCAEDSSDDDCISPKGKPGTCISLQKCHSLASMLSEDPPKASHIKYLQRSTCSLSDNDAKVCCPTEEVKTDPGSSSTTTSSPSSTTDMTTEQPKIPCNRKCRRKQRKEQNVRTK